tara:strand:+ start:156 stop:2168 length:2013 start_codon:yes stop_codon:yes gene_type:complete
MTSRPDNRLNLSCNQVFDNYNYKDSFSHEADGPSGVIKIKDLLEEFINPNRKDLIFDFSVGIGPQHTQIPWFAILNPKETTSTQMGIYIVGLFKADMSGLYLTLAQGAKLTGDCFGKKGRNKLEKEVIDAIHDLDIVQKLATNQFTLSHLNSRNDLRATTGVGLSYGSGVSLYKYYSKNELPRTDNLFLNDINNLIEIYDEVLDAGISANITPSWIIGSGAKGKNWENFKKYNFVSLGYDQYDIGDLNDYRTKNEIKNAVLKNLDGQDNPSNAILAFHQFSHYIRKNIYKRLNKGHHLYVRNSGNNIVGVGEVIENYKYYENFENLNAGKHIVKVKWLSLDRNYDMKKMYRKTLTNIRDLDLYKSLQTFYLGEDSMSTDKAMQQNSYLDYSIDNLLKGTFFKQEIFQQYIDGLNHRKNIIIQGPPGVGKTFIADRLAKFISQDEKNVTKIVFHENYSYEEFIMGIRPNEDGVFKLQKGIFYDICDDAYKNPDKKYVLVIDEINRANITKVFGELLVGIESDKREKEKIKLAYNKKEFTIPSNIYIIGLMNTADRSIKVVDYALRRRFAFYTLSPDFGIGFREFLKDKNIESNYINRIVDAMEAINTEIEEEDYELGSGYCIGHSYFCPSETVEDSEFWYKRIIDTQIKPLLQEYYFDNLDKANNLISLLD